MMIRPAIFALVMLTAASNAAWADSPFGQFGRVMRHVHRADGRARAKIDQVRSQVERKIRERVRHPRPLPSPVITPLPKPGPIIPPGPGPLPSPQPHPAPIDNVTLPIRRPVIVAPINCPSSQPRPLPIEAPAEPPENDNQGEGQRPAIHEGQSVTLPIEGLVDEGRVSVKLGPIVKAAKVLSWGPDKVSFEAPTVGLAEAAAATLIIAKMDGTQLAEIAFNLLPARPAAPQLPQVPAGSRLTLAGENFGQAQGNVRVRLGQIQLNASVLSWSQTEAVVRMPQLELESPAAAELIVSNQEGEVVERAAIELVAAK